MWFSTKHCFESESGQIIEVVFRTHYDRTPEHYLATMTQPQWPDGYDLVHKGGNLFTNRVTGELFEMLDPSPPQTRPL